MSKLPVHFSKNKHLFIGLIIAVISIVLDQISKHIILLNFGETSRLISEITSFFNIVLVWNHGISFGMFSNHPEWVPLILLGVTLAITIALIIWLAKAERRITSAALGLVIGGAIGNIIDRIIYGAVVDFLDFSIAGYHWPAFNIADASIFIGVVLLLIETIIEPKNNSSTNE